MVKIIKHMAVFGLILAAIFILSACWNNDGAANASKSLSRDSTIASAELTDRDQTMIYAMSDHAFVFNFNLTKEYEEATVWLEKYENGQLSHDSGSSMSSKVEGEGMIIFSTSSVSPDSGQEHFKMYLGAESGGGGLSFIQDISMIDEEGPITLRETIVNEKVPISEEDMVLASTVIEWSDSVSSIPPDFYEDVEGNLSMIEEYDIVYLLRARFD
ncbi:hypothetical protein APE02nite_08790 [Alkalibacterium pelagium]|uniref:Uncharacterized protein n=2 Tax=Alkalibacterium pelagium TaxID=426702 RepID=A0A1H7J8X4_9LACT|nr:hypothetical protein [Alkalibacterium pelagium]GEN50214.1 hypothetical protein APE02nite_08790 [Alkalibacterium pelagium]SEK71173.1 hypothetical protein SAMN04488099_105114 [Alkalibacterium pelagium]